MAVPDAIQAAANFDPEAHSDPIAAAYAFDPSKESTPAKPTINPAAAPSKTTRVLQGLGDTEFGVGQLVEHTPVLNTVVSGWRQLIQQGLKTAGFDHASELFNQSEGGGLTDQKAADNFDNIVRTREQEYQGSRAAAGQTGIDWWRLGGQAANPVNYLSAGAPAAGIVGRIGQGAAQGAMIAGEQPNAQAANYQNPETPGSYWWDKAKSMTTGAFAGGAAAAAVEAISPILKTGMGLARKYLGENISNTNAAESLVNDALRAKGKAPTDIDLNVYSAMKQQVKEALDSGAEDVSKEAVANQAIANSLPVPVRLMKGQATGDPMLYSTEQNLRGIQGVGEPITQRLQEQNAAYIQNLDALGAKDAPDVVSTSQTLSNGVQKFWDGIQQQKTQLYDAVKNSQGLSAAVDGQAAGQEIRETLGSPQAFHAWMTLPENIKQTVTDLEEGKLDLTVSNLQALDKAWGADAASADGSTAHAINQARAILGKAEIQDDVGKEAMQAYQAARQAHAQQMSLLEPKLLNGMPNPNFQPIVKQVVEDGKLDDVFQKQFLGASPTVAEKNMAFLDSLDPNIKETISKTTMGEIKRQALSSASDERGTVSQSVLTGWARDPVKSTRLQKLLSPAQFPMFKNLADTVEVAKRFPVASTVNTSNTGSAVVNAVTSGLKSSAAAQVTKRLPIVKSFAEAIGPGIEAAKTQSAVQSALSPGVTLKSLLSATPKQAATNRALSRLITPALVGATAGDKNKPNPPPE